ncbi:MAG: hypothetical protein KAI66_06580, partial [Lentisphaeria bacterium]|nr:hypothetical protein [Lentisphaeria bacterium]
VDLDGLAPNEERVLEYKQPALRRHVETFEFSQLSRPGVWVVEFIGNGRSSRALIRKGDLRHFLRSGSAGYVFHVFDEASRRVTDAALVLGGRRFEADERGEIVVPYSTKGGNVPFVLEHRGFAVRRSFAQGTERYTLDVSFHMDRESLLARNRAKLLVRARLLLGQVPVDIALLKNVFLDITATDGEGIGSTQSISVKKLRPDREYVHEMRVPQNLRNLMFILRGEVEMLTTGKKAPLLAVKEIELNGMDRTEFSTMFHLRPTAKGFVLEMLGKTGEPIAGRPVNLTGDHPDYARPFRTRLQTADNGRIQLGTLAGFERIYVQAEGVAPAQFTLPAREERHALPGTLHAVVGETITVVPDWLTPESLAADASLCELRGPSHGSQVFVADRRSHLRLQDDQPQIVGLPAGAFQLDLRQDGRPVGRIPIHVTKGRRDRAALLGVVRALEPTKLRPLGIRSVSRQDKTVRVRLANAGADTRVHVFVERFAGLDTPFLGLVRHLPTYAGGLEFVPRRSLYLSGRDIGDEYRYILERRRTTARPGNLLRKPSLILNPWSLGKTRTGKQEAREGKAWNAVAEKQAGRRISGVRTRAASFDGGGGSDSIGGGNITPAYDFLSGPSLLFANLKPDADGVVVIEIDADQLGPRQFLRVVAVDRDETVARDLHLPLLDETFKDLRLARSLPADEHFAERKLAEVVPAGKAFGVEDVRSSKVQTYDTLGKVFGLLRTLCPDQRLAEFEFLTRWDRLEPAAKRERFGKYACHE